MTEDLRVDCPKCHVPGQPVGLNCGFCGEHIPEPLTVLSRNRIDDGFKGFNLRGVGTAGIRLWSPSFPTEWQPHEWMIAECATHGKADPLLHFGGGYDPSHPEYHGSLASEPTMVTPVKACGGSHGHGCGFYCARGRNHLLSALPEYVMYSPERPKVIARVECAGKIILASNGYRAQKMRPLEIFVPHEFWKVGRDLKAVYAGPYPDGIECVVTTAATMLAAKELKWCEKCRGKLTGRSTVCKWCGHVHQ